MMKKSILTILVVVCGMLTMRAQDKYEYASVVYVAKGFGGARVSISKEGSFEQVNVTIKDGVMAENLSPVIEIVNKMAREGWEVYQNNTMVAGAVQIYYYLRKKKE